MEAAKLPAFSIFGEPKRGPENIVAGFSGEKIFFIFCLKWCTLVWSIFLSDGAPKRRGARGDLPLPLPPSPLDGPVYSYFRDDLNLLSRTALQRSV